MDTSERKYIMEPKSSSTPNRVVKKRKGIHEMEEIVSPVVSEYGTTSTGGTDRTLRSKNPNTSSQNRTQESSSSNLSSSQRNTSPSLQKRNLSAGDSNRGRTTVTHTEDQQLTGEDSYEDSQTDDESYDETESHYSKERRQTSRPRLQTQAQPQDSNKGLFIVFGVVIFAIAACFSMFSPPIETPKEVKISDLQKDFPLQNNEMWAYLKSGISEVKYFNKPSVFVFLYKTEAEGTLQLLLHNISHYASYHLNSSSNNPIELTAEQLNTSELINDYGKVISNYRDQLEERHVMIVQNLDEVPSSVAQAFHSFCDEFSPLVSKSLFLFTIKVDQFQGVDIKQVDTILRNKWKALDSDILEPLLTRIVSIAMKVLPEKY